MIFHKGSISEFFDLNFEIEFNYNVTEEKAREIIKNSYGQLKKADKILYWQKYYSVDKSKYILGPVEIYYPQKKEKLRDNLKENPLESKDGIPSVKIKFPEIIHKLKNKNKKRKK